MGLMDRDYWKSKGKKDVPSNKVSPEVARKMASLQDQIDKQLKKNPNHVERIGRRPSGPSEKISLENKIYNPREFRSSSQDSAISSAWNKERSLPQNPFKKILTYRSLYISLFIVMIALSFIIERGVTFEAIRNKIEIFLTKKNGSIINATASLAQSKDIIPGIIATSQTDFKNSLEIIDIGIDIPSDSQNFERYSTNHDFYYDKEHTNGSIAYRVISIDKEKNILNGKVNFYMWGASSAIKTSITRMENQLCPSKIERFEDKDDKKECEKRLGDNMSVSIATELGKPIRLRLHSKKENLLSGYYLNEFGKQMEIGGFKIPADAMIRNVLTHSLHFIGTISDCDEIKPFKIIISSVKNNGINGSASSHKMDPKFVCNSRVFNRSSNREIQQGTILIEKTIPKK